MDSITEENFLDILRCERTEHVRETADGLKFADYLHTLPLEISLIWPTPLNAVKVVCRIGFLAAHVSTFLGFLFSESIMFYRLYAISGRTKFMRIWLSVQFSIFHVCSFIAVLVFVGNVEYQQSPAPSVMPCLPVAQVSARWKEILLYGLLLASHCIILSITLLIMIREHKQTRNSLLSIFYRDGFMYFVGLAMASIVNIIIATSVPFNCDSMFLVRAILHLREQARRDIHGRSDNTIGMTNLQFGEDGRQSGTKKSDPSTDATESTAITSQI
ncbi:hypothetical protein BKA70DRAFT_1262606 [Coprinopsis sp. MPI-PUGE-AT-0042]|nr:hypothetical protein BKA70DRAFT_1262606 [Coprinopsis sp. MPI-PUGE-AT-0042]